MSQNRSNSFIQRLSDPDRRGETVALADHIGNKMIENGSRMFVVSGTTAYMTAQILLKKVRDIHILTNSVPVAWSFMQLVEEGKEAVHAMVSMISGEVKAVTGAIVGNPKIDLDASATLLFAPHGITEKGLVGNRDVEEIKRLVDFHKQVIMPVSWKKLGNPGSSQIKHWKQWKQVYCQIVITDNPLPSLNLTAEQHEEGEKLLAYVQDVMGDKLKIHRIPS